MRYFSTTITAIALAFATQVSWAAPGQSNGQWIQLSSRFTYQDANTSCTGEAQIGNELYVHLDFDDGSLKAARLQKNPFSAFPEKVQFSAEQLATLKLYRDPSGRAWIEDLTLDTQLAAWALEHSTEFGMTCDVPMTLYTVRPNPLVYHFDTHGLGDEVLVGYSKSFSFGGELKDGTAYKASMSFEQRKWEEPNG